MQNDSRKRAPKMERTRTPGIFKRGGRYVVVYRDSEGRQRKESHRTLEEAREAKGKRDGGDRRSESREPFADYARDWIDSYQGRTARGLAERTRTLYRRDLERWAVPYFGRRRLAKVERKHVRKFVAHLEAAGLAPSSVRAVLAPVKAMYADALEDSDVVGNPTAGVRVTGRRDGTGRRKARAMTRAELARMLDALPEDWRLFFELLAHTGLRISEAIGLEWRHVEFGERPRLLVRQQDCRTEVGELKSEHSRREVPLSPGMARRLAELARGHEGTDRVFCSALGRPLRDNNLSRRVLHPAREAAGLPWVTFHTFRHTCGSLLIERGRRIEQVSAWLGHVDAAFTWRTYVHLMDDGVGDADFMDDVAAPPLRAVA